MSFQRALAQTSLWVPEHIVLYDLPADRLRPRRMHTNQLVQSKPNFSKFTSVVIR